MTFSGLYALGSLTLGIYALLPRNPGIYIFPPERIFLLLPAYPWVLLDIVKRDYSWSKLLSCFIINVLVLYAIGVWIDKLFTKNT